MKTDLRPGWLATLFGTILLTTTTAGAGEFRIHICSIYTVAISADGWLQQWGGEELTPTAIAPSPAVTARPTQQFACGSNRWVSVDNRGTLWEWQTSFFDFPRPMPITQTDRVVGVAAGSSYTAVVLDDGSVWMRGELAPWGFDSVPEGEAVRVDALEGSATIFAGESYHPSIQTMVVLGRDGGLREWKTYSPSGPRDLSLPRPATAVAVGEYHALALTDDGRVWSWGGNDQGELGHGDLEYRTTPTEIAGLTGITAIAVDVYVSYALDDQGRLWRWGQWSTGIGDDGNERYERQLTPVRFDALETITDFTAGGGRLFATTPDGALWAVGVNRYGQLGDGTQERRFEPVRVIGFGNDAPPSPLPPAPRLSVETGPGSATLTVEAEDLREGLILYYAPFPEAEYVEEYELGEQRVTRFDLPAGSAYYVGVLIDDARWGVGRSQLSNVEHFIVP